MADASPPAPQQERWFVAAAGVCGFALAWVATSARYLALINWDNGSFLSELASRHKGWSVMMWNAHFGALHTYLLGYYAVHPFGGTFADGFRFSDSVCFAVNVAVIASATWRLSRDRLVAALLTAAWATSWVMIFLLLTLEDNILFLAPAAGVLWLCALRADRWTARDSMWAGIWAGFACLMSWQAMVYLGPAFYCAAIAGPRNRPNRERARAAAVLFGAFFATLVAWCAMIAATSDHKFFALIREMFSRPSGSFEMRGLGDLRGHVRSLGAAMAFFLTHTAYDTPKFPISFELLGAITWILQLGTLAAATWWSRRVRRWPLHVLAATMCLFSFVTPFYKDVEYRYLIRYDFLPPIVVMLIAGAYGEFKTDSLRRKTRYALIAALSMIVIAQSALDVRWDRARLGGYASLATWLGPHPKSGWYGRDGKSWYGYFRSVRLARPDACRQVFALDEIADGRWNLDIVGSLWSELPKHEVIAPPGAVDKWRFPPRPVDPAVAINYLNDGCSVLTEDARRILTTTH